MQVAIAKFLNMADSELAVALLEINVSSRNTDRIWKDMCSKLFIATL